MADQFNAEEVLTMAVRIEQNGQAFYKNAADAAEEGKATQLLRDLSQWEKGHENTFKTMKSNLTEEEKGKTAIDPYCEEAMFLKTMADQHVFRNKDEESFKSMLKDMKTSAIIDLALDFEKDSLLFFLGLARLVNKRLGKEDVYGVIDEEIGHISYLENLRRELT